MAHTLTAQVGVGGGLLPVVVVLAQVIHCDACSPGAAGGGISEVGSTACGVCMCVPGWLVGV
jgi:hypothetical protein